MAAAHPSCAAIAAARMCGSKYSLPQSWRVSTTSSGRLEAAKPGTSDRWSRMSSQQHQANLGELLAASQWQA